MNQRIFALALGALIVALCLPAQAQEEKKIPWIGYLAGAGSSPNQAFVQGMRDLGYVEGKNIAFVYRTTEGRRERYPDIVNELVRLKVNVLVTDVTSAAVALKKATNTIPIVMTSGTDPVETGLVASLARPGGNVTGLTNVGGELGGKLLELLKEITPRLTRVAILATWGSASGADEVFARKTEVPARALGVQLIRVRIQSPDDIDGAFRTITKERANGLLMRLQPSIYSAHYKRVADFTASSRLPSIAVNASLGGCRRPHVLRLRPQSFSTDVPLRTWIKSSKAPSLPTCRLKQPTKFELAINLKAAKQIGLTIPPNVFSQSRSSYPMSEI